MATKETAAQKLEAQVQETWQSLKGEDQDNTQDADGTEHSPESVQTHEQPRQTEHEPPEWTNLEPREDHPRFDGVPYDADGQRPSERIRYSIDFDRLRQKAEKGEPLTPEEYEQIEGRFRGMYREVRALDRMWNQLQYDQSLFQQQEAEKQYNDWYTNKTAELKTAIDNYDSEKQAHIQAELARGPQQEAQPALDSRTEAIIHEWEQEVDSHGNLVRPYALPDHPLHQFMRQQAASLTAHPMYQNQPVEVILQAVDDVMAGVTGRTQKQSAQPQPTPREAVRRPPEILTDDTNLRTRRNENAVRLDPNQMAVAERIFLQGPNAKTMTKEQAHSKYLASLQRLKKSGQM